MTTTRFSILVVCPTLPTVSFAPVEYMICNWKLVATKKVRYIFFLSYVKEIVITPGSSEENGKLIQLEPVVCAVLPKEVLYQLFV